MARGSYTTPDKEAATEGRKKQKQHESQIEHPDLMSTKMEERRLLSRPARESKSLEMEIPKYTRPLDIQLKMEDEELPTKGRKPAWKRVPKKMSPTITQRKIADGELLPKVKVQLFKDKKHQLMRFLELNPRVWALLEQYGVVDAAYSTENKGLSYNDQVENMVDHLSRGTKRNYAGFLRVLLETDQQYILTEILHEEVPEEVIVMDVQSKKHAKHVLSMEKEKLLVEKKPVLLQTIKVSLLFWNSLKKHRVITQSDLEKIQDESTKTEGLQIDGLIERLISGTNEEYTGFLKSLLDTGQEHVVTEVLDETLVVTQPLAAPNRITERPFPFRQDQLRKRKSHLTRMIKLSALFWAILKSHGIFTEGEIEDMQKKGFAIEQAQIQDIINHLLAGSDDQYHGFVEALIETGQEHIVTQILQEKLSDFCLIDTVSQVKVQEASQEKHQTLGQKLKAVKKVLQVTDELWQALIRNGVMSQLEAEILKSESESSSRDQVSDLIQYIKGGTDKTYNGFLHALSETGQKHIATDILMGSMSDGTSPVAKEIERTEGKVLAQEKGQLLLRQLSSLKESIEVTDMFWETLIKYHVLSTFEVDIFQDDGHSKAEQIQSLVEYLMNGTNTTYRGFLYSLSETSQRHVVTEILQETVPDLAPAAKQTKICEPSLDLTKEKKQLLTDKTPELIHQIKPTSQLLVTMTKHGVLSQEEVKLIQTENGSDANQVAQIVETLKRGSMGHYNAFVQSLIESNQKGVVTNILGEDIDSYTIKRIGPVIVNPKLNEAITLMKSEYMKTTFTSRLFKDINLQNVYTPLNMVQNMKHGKSKKITESEVLQKNDDGPVLTLCVGEAGTGKSTIAQRLAWLWAKQQQSTFFWASIKAVIFIQPTDEGQTLKQTIRNSIPGNETHKGMIMDLLTDEPEHVLVIVEAFDQYQKHNITDGIKRMIKDRTANILLTARTNHPCLSAEFRSMFNQHVEVKGFTKDEGIQFVQKMLNDINPNLEKETFLGTIDGKPFIESNPLNLTLTCQMYAHNELKGTHLTSLTEIKLYSRRESKVLEMEINRRKMHTVDELTEEVRRMHTLALYMFVGSKTSCTKADLDYLNIDCESPVMVLLEERSSTASGTKESCWVWPHARLQEFGAAMALTEVEQFKDSQWLLWLASRSDLNPMAQLVAAKLGMDGRSDDVATLTTATMILQCKAKCMAAEKLRDDSSHACRWITEVTKTLSQTITTAKAFDGHHCKSIQMSQKLPPLEAIHECKGGFFNENFKLFQHIQDFLTAGALDEQRLEIVSQIDSMLLPAVDSSDAGTLHLMLSQPSQWKESYKASGCNNITLLEIHLGLSFRTSGEEKQKDLKECVMGVLDAIKPDVIHIHQPHSCCQPPEELITSVNEKHYLINGRGNTWTVWSSSDNVKTSQQYVLGTTRSMYISLTKDDEITVNVERIQDALVIQPNDEYREKRTLVFNIGFPTIYPHQDEMQDTPSEYQETVKQLLDIWHPIHEIIICSNKTEVINELVECNFKQALREGNGYDMIYESEGTISLLHMAIPHQVTEGKQTYIYNSPEGHTTIRAQHLADIADIKADDISIDVRDTLTLYLSDGGDGSSISGLTEDFKTSIQHLLTEFKIQYVVLRHDHSNVDFDDFVNKIHESCMCKSGQSVFMVHRNRKGLQIIRKENIDTVEVPDSSRCIGIYESNNRETVIVATQYSDCKVLQKEHIKHPDNLSIHLKCITTGDAKEIAEQITADVDKTCLHLLETFHPSVMNIHLPAIEVDKYTGRMVLDDGATYEYSWTRLAGSSLVSFTRQPDALVLEVPNTSRCIQVYPNKGGMCIMTKELPDCLVLRQEHIQQPAEYKICVLVNDRINPDINVVRTTAGWQKTCRHILETFKPTLLEVNISEIESDITTGVFSMELEDHTRYRCSLDTSGTRFELDREDNMREVEVPSTSRSLRIYSCTKGLVVVADHLSDCMVLQSEHIRQPGKDNLILDINCIPQEDPNKTPDSNPTLTWEQSLRHLLCTFRPPSLHVNITRTGSGIRDGTFYMEVDQATFYECFWNKDGTTFYLTRGDNIQTVKVPDTPRCAGIYVDDNGDVVVVAAQLSDCLVLQKEHIKQPGKHMKENGEFDIRLHIDCTLHENGDESSNIIPTAGWQESLYHLLHTFRPPAVYVNITRTGSGIRDGTFYMEVDQDMFY